ncbi:uncharacterized protein EURHEDRAFT_401422 [Aspergillus ruber CBS 135680]|uniref:Uncharacterized protein n=1 Tax=Aspergillus ruber (strain CBS 135680) TaxID=1388766 RepID=A0A017SJE4_ASPRC|nr:uncharacterized protein EURHEDRAFT_401422 [Aspergillus ruber CBS 135680]EYE97038.1 hypothetical protein EURHEDRAFT_401422 [Aspergillus ruber CBS 135680]
MCGWLSIGNIRGGYGITCLFEPIGLALFTALGAVASPVDFDFNSLDVRDEAIEAVITEANVFDEASIADEAGEIDVAAENGEAGTLICYDGEKELTNCITIRPAPAETINAATGPKAVRLLFVVARSRGVEVRTESASLTALIDIALATRDIISLPKRLSLRELW